MRLSSSTLTVVPDPRQRMPRLAMLLTSTLLGCSAAPVRAPISWVGESEADVRGAYASHAIDSGVVYWGGSGRRTLYLALENGTQLWFDLDLRGTVVGAGGPEPKGRWVHYDRDSITVEGAQ